MTTGRGLVIPAPFFYSRDMADKSVYARAMPPRSKQGTADRYPDQDSPKHRAAIEKCDARKRLIAVSDQIAKSLVWFRNWKWPGSEDMFPRSVEMRTVEKYYPYAEGGPLLVDEPRDERDVVLCYEKQKVLKKLGFRHIVVESYPRATTLFDALEQLGEI